MPQPTPGVRSERLLHDQRAVRARQPGHARAGAFVYDREPNGRIRAVRHPAPPRRVADPISRPAPILTPTNRRRRQASGNFVIAGEPAVEIAGIVTSPRSSSAATPVRVCCEQYVDDEPVLRGE